MKGKEHILSSIENIIPLKSLSYLGVAVANQLWEDWQIDQAFDGHKITNSPVSTPLIARVLTINRWLEPTSYYSIAEWVKTIALPQILNLDPDTLNDDKLYDDLLYYRDLGEVDDKRYILGINPTLFVEQRSNREEKIKFFSQFISQLNQQLQAAKRKRSKEVIRDSIKRELARLKITASLKSLLFQRSTLPELFVMVQPKG